jgi:hypothetical protein
MPSELRNPENDESLAAVPPSTLALLDEGSRIVE